MATADEMFECVWPFCGVGATGLKTRTDVKMMAYSKQRNYWVSLLILLTIIIDITVTIIIIIITKDDYLILSGKDVWDNKSFGKR